MHTKKQKVFQAKGTARTKTQKEGTSGCTQVKLHAGKPRGFSSHAKEMGFRKEKKENC